MSSLADHYGKSAGKTPDQVKQEGQQALKDQLAATQDTPKEPAGEEKAKNFTETLDKEEKNSYINTKSDKSTDKGSDEDTYRSVLINTFGFDESEINDKLLKVAKSYTNAQSGYTKKAQSAKELESYKATVDQLDEVLARQPKLYDILKAASEGKDIENLLGRKESETGQSSTPPVANKLDVDEKTLVQSGYLDPSLKNYLSASEWDKKVFEAQMKYMPNVWKEEVTKGVMTEFQRQQSEAQEKQRQQARRQLTQQRYNDGYNQAIKQGWDFAGQHSELLPEIEEEMRSFRDKNDPQVIRPDAFTLASQVVAERNGVQVGNLRATQEQSPVKRNLDFDQRDINSKPADGKKLSAVDLWKQKSAERYNKKNSRYIEAWGSRKT